MRNRGIQMFFMNSTIRYLAQTLRLRLKNFQVCYFSHSELTLFLLLQRKQKQSNTPFSTSKPRKPVPKTMAK